ncbi:MAG: SbcC/MukB-like Walker B domain-containing protein, partial [Ferruginibacter sp.]
EHRQQLKDGEACPLCGALEHPFGNGNIPVINDNQRTLEKAKKESAALSEAIVSVEKEITRLTTLREQAAEQNTTETEKLKAAKNKFNKELQRLAVAFPALITADECEIILSLETIENETKIKLATFDQLIQTVNESQKTIESIRDFELLKADREKQTAQLSHFNAENEVTIQANLLTTKKQALDSLAATLANNMSSLQSTFEAFGVSNIEALRDCFTSWNENKTRLDSLSEEKKKLESSIRVNEVQRNGQQEMIDKTTKDVESLEQVLLSLTNERTSVFGQKIVEEEETALMAAVRNMDMSKKAAEIELNNANNEVENIKSIIAANSKELKQLTQKQITDKSREELSALYAEKKRVLNELLQQIGANTERRRASDESRKQAGQKLIEKQTQQAIVNKWAQLNDLIGSATGIKFRNFAQALTFEHLVSVSNTQLQKMSDRYLLQRTDDHTNPFELSVIDKYQNNEIRTAQNLSGGEKFIVSLSLALGLANMAGKNMRIDTMFIDEGFGTLDPEYLDVALNALSSLQHEGKIIGVISHLSELKERISTHIEVISTGNGHSTIQPGF